MRYHERRVFGPSREWESLPIVGSNSDRDYKVRVWRRVLATLGLFWAGVAAAVFWWVV